MACQPRYETKSIIVEDYNQRGKITDSILINPCPDPQVFPNYSGPLCGGGEGANWYFSNPPFALGNGAEVKPFSQPRLRHISGPSLGEGQANVPGAFIYVKGFSGNADAASSLALGYLPAVNRGGKLPKYGPITGIRITNRGANIRTEGLGFQDLGSGGGADFALTVSGGRLTNVQLLDGGNGYDVGNDFKTQFLSFGGGSDGYWTVTSIATPPGDAYLNWWIVDVRKEGGQFGGPGNFLTKVDGYAIGDRFEYYVPSGNNSDKKAIFEVTAIEVNNDISSDINMSYTIEKDMGLVFGITSNDRIVDLVVDYDSSNENPVLVQSADTVFQIWLSELGRKPTDLEFQYYVRQIFVNEGQVSPQISAQIASQFASEIQTNVAQVLTCEQREQKEQDDQNLVPDGASCLWDRRDFYQGSNSGGRNIQMKELWDFLGQPNGPSGPGGGAAAKNIICPKPLTGEGEIADFEPDMSDFAGMRLWRWKPCVDGTNGGNPNIGNYDEVIVPCPGEGDGCVNPTTEDALAVYEFQSTIYYNNNTTKLGNFVISTKDTQAEAINQQYLTTLGRPAETEGLNYWYDQANKTIETANAIYYARGYVAWNNGTETTVNTPLVKQPKNPEGQAVYAQYWAILGRPPETTGFEYWVEEAKAIGIDATLANIVLAAPPELSRGGVKKIEFGLTRTLSDLVYQAQSELSKGGVKEKKLYCDTLEAQELPLSFFLNTRLPPQYGGVTLNPPQIVALKTADSRYFNYNPTTQTEKVASYSTALTTTFSNTFSNDFRIQWSDIQGDTYGESPPIVIKYVKFDAYSSINGIERLLFSLQNYDNDKIADIVGPRVLTNQTNTTLELGGVGGWKGSLPSNSTLDNMTPLLEFDPDGNARSIPLDDAKDLCFDESPSYGTKQFWKVTARVYCLDPETDRIIPQLSRSQEYVTRTDTQTMRFFSSWAGGGQGDCPDGFKTCPDGSTVCEGDPCGEDPNPGEGCNGLTISCGGNNTLTVENGKPTTITFAYRVNKYSECDTVGSARVSIRRYWPCDLVTNSTGKENQWIVQKAEVPLTETGDAVYRLPVVTDKSDYLPTTSGSQTVNDPGSCHWVYVAYWEILGMNDTSIRCNYRTWENPGCDTGRPFNTLDEILCVQKADCTEGCQQPDELTFGGLPCPPLECNEDCPTCEQIIKVVVGETTQCGPVKFPELIQGGGPGANNGRFTIGKAKVIDSPDSFATVIPIKDANLKTRQLDGKKVVPVKVENWVSVASAVLGSQTTLGKDNAISFQGTKVNCEAQMKVTAQWYYKVKYKTTGQTGLLPLDFWENYDTPDEKRIYNISTDYYPTGAGNSTNGVFMSYRNETSAGSYYSGNSASYLPADNSIDQIEVYLLLKASNNEFGNSAFNNPPAGFSASQFGTDSTVSDGCEPGLTFGGNSGGCPPPKAEIFKIGTFKLGNELELPTADWDMSISGCSDAQVYETVPSQTQSLRCGDPNSDNWYYGYYEYNKWKEEGKQNGQPFSLGYPGTSRCQIFQTFNPNNGSGTDFSSGPHCPESYGFSNCKFQSDVVLSVNGPNSIDFGGYNPVQCTQGIKLMWYVDGVCRSNGHVSGPTGDGGYYRTYSDLSCGERFEELSRWMDDPNKTYTVEAIALVNNGDYGVAYRPVNKNWTTQNGDPYAYFDKDEWQIGRGSSQKPINIIDNIQEDDYFQIILAGATCTVKGNGGGNTSKTLTGLRNPDITLELFDVGAPEKDCLTASDSECCDPRFATNNPTNRCDELLDGGFINCCEGGGSFGTGKLRAKLSNSTTAWPTIPGTSTRVVGSTKYYWEKRGNNNQWSAVPGGTGDVISIVRDGSTYRCTVTYDLAGFVPSGYTANPQSSTAVKQLTVTSEGYETCPDGSVKPIGQCAPDVGPCTQPEFVTVSPPAPAAVFIANTQGNTQLTKVTVNNNEEVRVSFLPNFKGFGSVSYVSGKATLYDGSSATNSSSGLSKLGITDQTYLTGSTTITGSNKTKTYSVRFEIRYRCPNQQTVLTTSVTVSNAVEITWGSDQNTGYPKMIGSASCYTASGYKNSAGCGSYLAYWKNTSTSPQQLYNMKVRNSNKLSDRGPAYSGNSVQQNASCTICPSAECPQLAINSVTVNPTTPEKNKTFTMNVNFSWDNKGYTENEIVSGLTTIYSWAGPNASDIVGSTQVAKVNVRSSVAGKRKYTVTVTKFVDDPQQNCCTGGQFSVCGLFSKTYNVEVNVVNGGSDPVDPCPQGYVTCWDGSRICRTDTCPEEPTGPDPIAPTMTTSISGDSNLTLNNGSVTGAYSVDFDVNPGRGYRASDRKVTVKWDGGSDTFEKFNYSRTFNRAATYTVTAKVAKLFAKPGYTGSVAGASSIPTSQQYWVISEATFNVRVAAQVSNDIEPTVSINTTASKTQVTLVNGKASVSFSTQAVVNSGTWAPTPEPSALRYNVIDGSNSQSTLIYNATTANWTTNFTKAGTYRVGSAYRKNYCKPGTPTPVTSTCTGGTKVSKYTGVDYATVVVKAEVPTGPIGTKPTVTLLPEEYQGEVRFEGGCAIGYVPGEPVSVTLKIALTQGTGDYVWDDARAGSGWTRNGLQMLAFSQTARLGEFGSTFGTTVDFYKNGKIIHSVSTGRGGPWCIKMIQRPQGPGPGLPDFNFNLF